MKIFKPTLPVSVQASIQLPAAADIQEPIGNMPLDLLRNSGFDAGNDNLPRRLLRSAIQPLQGIRKFSDAGLKLAGADSLPLSAIIYLTYGCNFKCPHCTFPMIQGGKQLVSAQQWIHVIEELRHAGILNVHLMGGEPSLLKGSSGKMDGVIEVARAAKNLDLSVSIVSNGLIHKMAEDVVDNIDLVTLSLDSVNREKNDRLRWRGSHDMVMKSIHRIRAKNPDHPILISMVLGSENGSALDDVQEMIRFCNDNKVYLYLLPMRAESNEGTDAKSVAESDRRPNVGNKGALERVLPFRDQLAVWKYVQSAKWNGDCIANSDVHLRKMIELCQGGAWPLQDGCNFSRGMVIIQADGAIGKCNDWGGDVGKIFTANGSIVSGGLRRLLTSPEYKSHQKIGQEGCVECTSCSWDDASWALEFNPAVLLTSPIFYRVMTTTQGLRKGVAQFKRGVRNLM